MSQPDFLYELFEDFMDDPANQNFSMDNGLVCRWMTGQAKISPKTSIIYGGQLAPRYIQLFVK